jgi:DNA primase
VDVAVARLPQGSDPAELAQRDPQALRDAIANAVPFLQFRLERVLDTANLSSPEGRARAAEAALRVLAEHPSDLVRDQYLLTVADRLRIDVAALRPRVLEMARNPNAPQSRDVVERPTRSAEALPRPGLEALRLALFAPELVAGRLVEQFFVHPTQREIFVGIAKGLPLSQVIDQLERAGESEAARVLSELAVSELDRSYTHDDVSAVVSQLLRSAVAAAMKDIERDLRSGALSPDLAMATIRDVKQRLDLLQGPEAASSEVDLREWLVARGGDA